MKAQKLICGVMFLVQAFGEKGMLLCENVREDPVHHFTDSGSTASVVQYSFPQRYVSIVTRPQFTFSDCNHTQCQRAFCIINARLI